MKSKILVLLALFSFISTSYGYDFIHNKHVFCNSKHSEADSEIMFIIDKVGLLTKPGECDTIYSPQDYSDIDDFHMQINHAKITTQYIGLQPVAVPRAYNKESFKVCVTAYDCNKSECKHVTKFYDDTDVDC